ncbi:hypothetical protein HK102_009937 [Quaeritorhiza haematococci]|nr:hypothetical protein HK102_009937 [Quaeritorhiza haematococci]
MTQNDATTSEDTTSDDRRTEDGCFLLEEIYSFCELVTTVGAHAASSQETAAPAKARIEGSVMEWGSIWDVEIILTVEELRAASGEYVEELITCFFEKSMEKKPEFVRKTAELFVDLFKKEVVGAAVFEKSLCSFMEVIEDVSIDVPDVYKRTGTFLGRLVSAGVVKISALPEIFMPLTDSPAMKPPGPKLLAETLINIRETDGTEVLEGLVSSSSSASGSGSDESLSSVGVVDWKLFWPADKRNDDAVAEWIIQHDLFVLDPTLKIVKGLKGRFGKEGVENPPSLLAYWETCLQWVTEAVTTKNLTLRPDCEERVVQTILDFVIPKLAEVTSWLDVAAPLEYKPPKDTSYEGSGQVLSYLAITMSQQMSAGRRKGLGIFTNMSTIQFVLVDCSACNYNPRFDFLPTGSVNTLNSGSTGGFSLLCAVLQGPHVNTGFQLQQLTFEIGGESYRVRRHLGTGGWSNVYEIRKHLAEKQLNSSVLPLVVHPQSSQSQTPPRRLRDGMLMNPIGVPLLEQIEREASVVNAQGGQTLDPSRFQRAVWKYVEMIIDAIRDIHTASYIHNDLRPHNIIVNDNNIIIINWQTVSTSLAGTTLTTISGSTPFLPNRFLASFTLPDHIALGYPVRVADDLETLTYAAIRDLDPEDPLSLFYKEVMKDETGRVEYDELKNIARKAREGETRREFLQPRL